MTLMPVSRISDLGRLLGEGRGRGGGSGGVSVASTGPFSSTGSPMTLRMRPRVPSPTGTEIGAPVSLTDGAADEAVGRVHRDGADGDLAEVLGDLEHEALAVVVGLERVQDLGQVAFELDVDDRADDLGNLAGFVVSAMCRFPQSVRAPRRPR